MIPAEYYQTIYLFVVFALTLLAILDKRSPLEKENIVPSLLLLVVVIIFIGYRPHNGLYFGDMYSYFTWWGVGKWSGFKWDAENILFDNMKNTMANVGMTATDFFIVMATIYFSAMWIACRKLFPNHILLSFLICLGAFSTFSYGTNGIKAGAAGALFMAAIAYSDKRGISILLLLLSWGFHHSMALPVAAYALTLYFKNSNWYFWGWCVCLFFAAFHITLFQEIFAGFSDESGRGYLVTNGTGWGGGSGFRIDFVFYSSMPVLLGYYVIHIYQLRDELYENILNTYLCTNGIWMLCMYANFTNRIAYLSWCIYPLLIAYPCLSVEDQNHQLLQNRNIFILMHIGFTMALLLVYM